LCSGYGLIGVVGDTGQRLRGLARQCRPAGAGMVSQR
jgi:hypothetical protein